jgi:hypothetical protein
MFHRTPMTLLIIRQLHIFDVLNTFMVDYSAQHNVITDAGGRPRLCLGSHRHHVLCEAAIGPYGTGAHSHMAGPCDSLCPGVPAALTFPQQLLHHPGQGLSTFRHGGVCCVLFLLNRCAFPSLAKVPHVERCVFLGLCCPHMEGTLRSKIRCKIPGNVYFPFKWL